MLGFSRFDTGEGFGGGGFTRRQNRPNPESPRLPNERRVSMGGEQRPMMSPPLQPPNIMQGFAGKNINQGMPQGMPPRSMAPQMNPMFGAGLSGGQGPVGQGGPFNNIIQNPFAPIGPSPGMLQMMLQQLLQSRGRGYNPNARTF
jgi:hypothetical protein